MWSLYALCSSELLTIFKQYFHFIIEPVHLSILFFLQPFSNHPFQAIGCFFQKQMDASPKKKNQVKTVFTARGKDSVIQILSTVTVRKNLGSAEIWTCNPGCLLFSRELASDKKQTVNATFFP